MADITIDSETRGATEMNDDTRRGLRQLLPPLKTLAGMVERAYETDMHKGTAKFSFN
jgi:hypothetical protein